MEMTNNSPDRLYYRLEEAASKLECSASYLLHLGATEQAVMMFPSQRKKWMEITWKETEESLVSGSYEPDEIFDPIFISVPWFVLANIEVFGKSEFGRKAGSYWAIFPAQGAPTLAFHRYSRLALIDDEPPIILDSSVIFIGASEVERLKSGTPLDIHGIGDHLAQPGAMLAEGKDLEIRHGEPSSEQEKLSRILGAVALLIAERSDKYKVGSRPNAKQIASDVAALIEDLGSVKTRGLGDTSIRTAISEGVKALTSVK